MEQQITDLVNLVQTQGNQLKALADDLREVNRKNALLENSLRSGSTNLKLMPSSLAAPGSVILSLSFGRSNLTLNVYEQFKTFMRAAKLQTGTNLTLAMFCDCMLVLLDKVSADTLNSCITNYNSANERHAEEEKSTDFKRNGDFENPTFRDELFPRFVRFVIKYLFTEEIQEVVLGNYTHFATKGDVQNMIPTAIIRKLEEYRNCSEGTRPEKVLSRGAVFLAFKAIMKRASTRHLQTLSLNLAVIQATYSEVEHLADGSVNPAAEASHQLKMAAIGTLMDQQYHSMSAINSLQAVNNVNLLFNDQATPATVGSGEYANVINLPSSNTSCSSSYGIAALGFTPVDAYETSMSAPDSSGSPLSGTSLLNLGDASPSLRVQAVLHNMDHKIDKIASKVHKISLDNICDSDEEEEENLGINTLTLNAIADDLLTDDTFAIATACDLTPACIHKIMARTALPVDQVTCFFCKEKGHYRNKCPKLNTNSGGRNRSKPNHYNPSGPDPRRGKPFSSVFGKSKAFNGRKQISQLKRPNTKFRAYGRFRNAQTGGGYKVHMLTTSADIDALPEEAEIFFCDATVEKVQVENRLYFDLA